MSSAYHENAAAIKVQHQWQRLLQQTGILDRRDKSRFHDGRHWRDDSPRHSQSFLTINVMIVLWHLYCAFKQFFCRFTGLPDYVCGNTLSRTGNVNMLMQMLAASAFITCACYRLALIRSYVKGQAGELQSTLDQLTERVMQARDASKVKVAKAIYCAAVAGLIVFHLSLFGMICGLLAVNLMTSGGMMEQSCWIFYYIIDHVLILSTTCDMLMFPFIWILVALCYNIDLQDLLSTCQRLSQEIACLATDAETVSRRFDRMRHQYLQLLQQSRQVNAFLSPILFVQTTFAQPLITCCLFITRYSDNIALYGSLPGAGGSVAASTYTLMAIGAHVSAKSDRLYELLVNVSCVNALQPRLSVSQRHVLHGMILELGSNQQQLLPLLTLDGIKYTSELLAVYVIESCLQYFLLMTFDQFFKLH